MFTQVDNVLPHKKSLTYMYTLIMIVSSYSSNFDEK